MLDKHMMEIWKKQESEKIVIKALKEKLRLLENGYTPTYVEISEYHYNILKDAHISASLKIGKSKETLLGLKIIVNPYCKEIKVL